MNTATTAAAALATALPTSTTLDAVLRPITNPIGDVSRAVTASFVGAPSADFAVALIDDSAINAAIAGDTASTLTAADVLLPALEAAAASLGSGILGRASVSDARALFSDTSATIFELRHGAEVAGWFAARIRAGGTDATVPEFVASKLGRINSVEMSLTVEIGHTRMSIRDVLALEPGAVVELDRSAGAPADILLNGRLIAFGEVVVVDQDYAVRVTKILDTTDGTI